MSEAIEKKKAEKPQSSGNPCEAPCYAQILDACCGPKGMWFDKDDDRVLFMDKRKEVLHMSYPSGEYTEDINPDVIGDFTSMQFADNSFKLVVFDPPHIQRSGPDGRMTKRYGYLTNGWREMLAAGFKECFRVLEPGGFLIFKWCEVQFPVSEILQTVDKKPLFGHKSGKRMNTHWICFVNA